MDRDSGIMKLTHRAYVANIRNTPKPHDKENTIANTAFQPSERLMT
jgi:hypothetical protein